MLQNELNLLRHLAWSFHRTTGIEYDELFSQATLTYCELISGNLCGAEEHDPTISKHTTYVYHIIRNHLIWWCDYQFRRMPVDVDIDYLPVTTVPVYEYFSNMDPDVKKAFEILVSMFENEDFTNGRAAKSRLTYELRQRGWAWGRIEKTLKKAKEYVNQTEVGGIILQ